MSRAPLATTLLVLLGGLALGAEDPRETADPGQWLQKAAQDGLAEVQLGKLAQQKGTSPQVKAFGRTMMADHGKANDQLAAIAARRKMPLPHSLDPAHQAAVAQLSARAGREFDTAYAERMVTSHAQAIDLFTQATQGMDRELAAFAQQTLPTLKHHKEMADTLAARAGSSVTSSSSDTAR